MCSMMSWRREGSIVVFIGPCPGDNGWWFVYLTKQIHWLLRMPTTIGTRGPPELTQPRFPPQMNGYTVEPKTLCDGVALVNPRVVFL